MTDTLTNSIVRPKKDQDWKKEMGSCLVASAGAYSHIALGMNSFLSGKPRNLTVSYVSLISEKYGMFSLDNSVLLGPRCCPLRR